MEEISISTLSVKLRRQLNKADYALDQGNKSYATNIYLTVLQHAPSCLDVRKQLRKAQFSKDLKKYYFIFYSFRTYLLWPKWRRAKIKAQDLMLYMEKELSRNPFNTMAHKIIADTAEALGLKKTAVFAYETLCDLSPDNLHYLLSLAKIYMKYGHFPLAITVTEKILEKYPQRADVVEMLQRASLAAASHKNQ